MPAPSSSLPVSPFGSKRATRDPSAHTHASRGYPREAWVWAEGSRVALFDPKGETGRLLDGAGIRLQRVEAATDLAPYELLIVGKQALTPGGPGPNVDRVRDGLKVIVFEQSAEVLE